MGKGFVENILSSFFVFGGLCLFLLAVLVGVIVYFAFHKTNRQVVVQPEETTETILARGRMNVVNLRRIAVTITNQEIKHSSEDICKSAEEILQVLKEQPENIPLARQFLNFYLPTLEKILLKYKKTELAGLVTLQITEKTLVGLGDIKIAMEKQYKNLFEDDALDLTVEMNALLLACKRDGLLPDEQASIADNENEIVLRL